MKPSTDRKRRMARAAERIAKKFGPRGYWAFVVSTGCIVGNESGYKNCSRKIDFAHGHGKDGQDWTSAFGCCANHHTLRGDSFHTLGPLTFPIYHGVDPACTAARLVGTWYSMTNEQRQAWKHYAANEGNLTVD